MAIAGLCVLRWKISKYGCVRLLDSARGGTNIYRQANCRPPSIRWIDNVIISRLTVRLALRSTKLLSRVANWMEEHDIGSPHIPPTASLSTTHQQPGITDPPPPTSNATQSSISYGSGSSGPTCKAHPNAILGHLQIKMIGMCNNPVFCKSIWAILIQHTCYFILNYHWSTIIFLSCYAI